MQVKQFDNAQPSRLFRRKESRFSRPAPQHNVPAARTWPALPRKRLALGNTFGSIPQIHGSAKTIGRLEVVPRHETGTTIRKPYARPNLGGRSRSLAAIAGSWLQSARTYGSLLGHSVAFRSRRARLKAETTSQLHWRPGRCPGFAAAYNFFSSRLSYSARPEGGRGPGAAHILPLGFAREAIGPASSL